MQILLFVALKKISSTIIIENEKLCPNIGNNVDIGVGAIIIGNVNIADGCIIGAGAVVTKSFDKINTVIVGVPGKAV